MSVINQVYVTAEWHVEDGSGVWIATSEDVPGLVVEELTPEELGATLTEIIPVLLHENGIPTSNNGIKILLQMKRTTELQATSIAA